MSRTTRADESAGPDVPETPYPGPRTADDLIALVKAGDRPRIAWFFAGLPEKDRRAYVKPLRDHVKTLNWNWVSPDPAAAARRAQWHEVQNRRDLEGPALLVAGAGAVTGAVALAKFFRTVRRSAFPKDKGWSHVLTVLDERDPSWLGELPAALAEHSPWRGGDDWRLIAAVADRAGVGYEATPAMVEIWGAAHRGRHGRVAANLAQDPNRDRFVPMLFDVEGNDNLFGAWQGEFGDAVVALAAQGDLDRGPILDASLGRLLRGGRPGALQGHVEFWRKLALTDAEAAPRITSIISLLSAQHGPTAREFTELARRLSDAGVLDVEQALEAAAIAVTRSEKNIVRTALSWLDALAAAHPDRLPEIAGVIATGFGASGADVQERAVKLIVKRAAALPAADVDRLIAEGEVHLAPDLAASLAEGLGRTTGPEDPARTAYPEVAPYLPRPLPAPIASPAELAEEFSALMHTAPEDAIAVERVLAAIVEFHHTEREALAAALDPVVEGHAHIGQVWTGGYRVKTVSALAELARVAAGRTKLDLPHRPTIAETVEALRGGATSDSWKRSRQADFAPTDVLTLRAVEAAAALAGDAAPPRLVATPTAANGALDAAVLADRLRAAAAEGWEPLVGDWQQALLRVPPGEPGTEPAIDVTDLTSPAGEALAAWLAGRGPVLPAVVFRDHKYVVDLPAPEAPRAPETLFDLLPYLWNPSDEYFWYGEDWRTCWAAIVPIRADLAAAAVNAARPVDFDYDDVIIPPTLPALIAETDDPAHAGLHRVLAARLIRGRTADRAGCVDAALVLAGRGLLDGARLGRDLADVIRLAGAGLTRTVPALRDLANGGAAPAVWAALAELLGGVLPPRVPRTLAGTGELLALATELADALAVRGEFEDVSALAAKKGGSAASTAAKRLVAVLAKP